MLRRTRRCFKISLPALAVLCFSVGNVHAQTECVGPECDRQPIVQVELTFDQDIVHATDTDAVLMVEVIGADAADTLRTTVAMAIVIDASGSMRGTKMNRAQEAAHALVDELEDGDTLTLVAYSDSATVLLENYAVGPDREAAHDAIDDIEPGGNTCISCGLENAYSTIETAPYDNIRRVVMLSDGIANRGISDEEGLNEVASLALALTRSATTTIGVGSDYNEALLSTISAGGMGAYYYLPNPSRLASILDRELASLESTIATNVAIDVRPEVGITLGPTEAIGAVDDGNGIVFNLGQLSAGERRQFLVPMTLPPGELGQVATATTTYVPVGGDVEELVRLAHLERTDNIEVATASSHGEVQEQVSRLESVNQIETAIAEFQEGNTEEARERLRRSADRLEEEADNLDSATLRDEAAAVRLLETELVDAAGDDEEGEETVRELYLQNDSRANEVMMGVPAEDMFHSGTVAE